MGLRLLVCPCSLHVCCLPKDAGATASPHTPFLPIFCLKFPLLLPEVPVPPTTVATGLRKACWAVSQMPLSLLVLGKADKEQQGVLRQPAAGEMLPALTDPGRVQGAGVSERVRGALAWAGWLPAVAGRAAVSPEVILEKYHP